ncbi:MAG: 4-hydroxybenzoate polyprenyltransferase [Eubacteriales bacterium]|nr:4-hydroxybenzoate polyprenyltransferase [Eubacteriales bacterium]
MVWNRIREFGEMIKFEHTIFALPFAYLGAFLAQGKIPSAGKIFWITMAMVGARTAAMALNRIIDRHIDARNPRTAGRHLPTGKIKVGEAWVYVILSLLLLYISAARLNPLCVKLMPVAVIFLVGYSYTKRFTSLCHLILGITDGLAPLGGWIAVTGSFALPAWLLFAGVATWIAGFDIIYACQDVDFDRREGLYSIPARLGIASGLLVSRLFHFLTIVFFVLLGFSLQRGLFYWLGVVAAAVILAYEQSLISPHDLSRLNTAFFNMNGILSVVFFGFTLADIIYKINLF